MNWTAREAWMGDEQTPQFLVVYFKRARVEISYSRNCKFKHRVIAGLTSRNRRDACLVHCLKYALRDKAV